MVLVSVHALKTGERLSEDVLTPHGNVLLQKGKQLTSRDIEILHAFLVKQVQIEEKTSEVAASIETEESMEREHVYTNRRFDLYRNYEDMIHFLKKVFAAASPNLPIPVLELRTKFEALIACIDEYQPLTFRPRSFQVEDYLYHNSLMTALTSYLLAMWHELPQKDWIPIGMSGLLHDIGNVLIDQAILNKPTKLMKWELEEVKKHPILGYQILKSTAALNEGVKLCALQHHERLDGTGYPLGVTGEKIHIYAKVMAIADMFHAMTSNRRHQNKMSPYVVLEQLFDESFGKLDPELVQTFIQKSTQFHHGTVVKLSDQSVGEIVFSDRAYPTRPWVKVGDRIVNLTTDRHLHIEEVIQVR